MDAAEYKHVVLGLIFLKYVSDVFNKRERELATLVDDKSSEYFMPTPEAKRSVLADRDEYLAAGVFWIPEGHRWEDLRAAAAVLKGKKIADTVRGIVSPATPDIFKMALSEGIIDIFHDAGFAVTNPTCGACLGMSNGVLADGEVCASTTNRNFYGRMGKGGTVHLMSPATAAASAITGVITNSPLWKKN